MTACGSATPSLSRTRLPWVLTVDSSIAKGGGGLAVREAAGDELEHLALACMRSSGRASRAASGSAGSARARSRGRRPSARAAADHHIGFHVHHAERFADGVAARLA
jgi:hypothetical protein